MDRTNPSDDAYNVSMGVGVQETEAVVRYAVWHEEPQFRPGVAATVFGELRSFSRGLWISVGAFYGTLAFWIGLDFFISPPPYDYDAAAGLLFSLLSLILLGAFVAIFLYLLTDASRRRILDAERLESGRDVGTFEQLPVSLRIFAGRTCIGEDIGLASITDGFLYYSGEKTSFSFSPAYARLLPRVRLGLGLEYYDGRRRFRLWLQMLMPLSTGDPFRTVRRLWAQEPSARGAVEVLPPTSVGPNIAYEVIRWWVRGVAVPLTLAGIPILLFCWGTIGRYLAPSWPPYLLLGATLVVPWVLALLGLIARLGRLSWAGHNPPRRP